jgi:hypothetical protein
MESPIIEGFVDKQYEIKSPAWSGKTTEGLAGLPDCHKAVKMNTARKLGPHTQTD